MITLYVKEQGARVRRTGQRLQVLKREQVLETVRLRELERVVLLGNVEISASAQAALLEEGIETVLLSFAGRYRGRLSPAEGKNVFLRQAQFRRYDEPEYRLSMARTLLDAKIRNARYVLQRYLWNHPDAALEQAIEHLEKGRARLERQTNLDALLGVEGESARVYFGVFGRMVRSDFAFVTRSRRPPRDPVNALLSFGYTLLTTELVGAVAAQGLDPYVGILHDLAYGRPSLALDLLEEFRQPVMDRLVLSLVNRGVLNKVHFDDRGEGGVLLTEVGRTRFFDFYHKMMEATFEDRTAGGKTSYRSLLQRQARRVRAAILGEAAYEPFAPR
jgi:CRISPR-associated protein Cas1